MARLRALPDSPRRALGYVRVSMAREEMVSPELQRAAIESYCEQRGYRLAGVIEELDVTGRNFARKGVQQAIETIEAGEAEVIVVWKVSRFGRTRRDWYVHADRVEVAGGSLESATEHFDPLTSTGRLTRGMLVELAAWESDVKSEQWKEAQAHRLRAGLPHTPTKRFGYAYDKRAKIHRPDPETGPILAECYRRYIAGETPYRICQWLNEIGVTTTTGNRWEQGVLRQVLAKGFGAGYLYLRQEKDLVPGAHEPVIDQRTWKAYLRRKAQVSKQPPQARRGTNPLTGLVVCAGCDKTMNIWQGWQDRGKPYERFYRAYRCNRGCGRNYVGLPVLLDAVRAFLEAEVGRDLDERAEVKAAQQAKRAVAKTDRAMIVAQIGQTEKAISRADDAFVRGIMPETSYQAARASLEAERKGLEERLLQVDGEIEASKANVRPVARSLLADFDVLMEQTPAQMKLVLASLIREIRVQPGKVADKVAVVPRWT